MRSINVVASCAVLMLTGLGPPAQAQGVILGVASGMSVGAEGIRGQPYTAVRKMTSFEKLADGTTITRESKSREARDAEGRTMHELKPQMPGDWHGPEISHVTVMDPVAHVMISWSSGQLKQANVFHIPERPSRPVAAARQPATQPSASASQVGVQSEGTAPVLVKVPPAAGSPRAPGGGGTAQSLHRQVHREQLPSKSIAGIYVEGVRTTITTPVGLEGNDRPLVSIREVWTSPDLKIVMLETSEDERSRLQMMELVDLNRADPDPQLFKVPEGYTVKEQQRQGLN